MNDLARDALDRSLASNEMATKHRAKTKSVWIDGTSFRCAPGSRREMILLHCRDLNSAPGIPNLTAGMVAGAAFLLGYILAWWTV